MKEEVERAVAKWLRLDRYAETKAEIQKLVDENNEHELEKALLNKLKFGTAGLRERMRAGFAYMNNLTVQSASQGLAIRVQIEREHFEMRGTNYGIAIGRDGRYNSEIFSQIAAAVFLSKGIPVYYFQCTVPTPLLAYAVKRLNLAAGVMVTASHNPKDDNGYKVYWECGSQIVSPIDAEIAKCIQENEEPWDGVDEKYFLDLQAKGSELLLNPLPSISDDYYSEIVEKCCFTPQQNAELEGRKIVYTAMHGVGAPWAAKAMEAFKFASPLICVAAQNDPDPSFPTVPFPNPEEGRGALKLAIDTAEEAGSSLIVANDPDADRFAAAEKLPDGTWKIFTGNEIGILIGDWVWQRFHEKNPDISPSNCFVLNTTVSSKILKSLADTEGFRYEETLTGFKWLGTVAKEKMDQGLHFLYAFEEAIGYMIFDVCMDKDGVRTTAMFAEMANYYHRQNKSLVDHLNALYAKYGYYATRNKYFFCYDPKIMFAIFDKIRLLGSEKNGYHYPQKIGRFNITRVRDLTIGYDSNEEGFRPVLPVSASTQMITFYFENGAVFTIRGSGTEPKLKYYCELNGSFEEKDVTIATLNEMVASMIEECLQPEKNGLLPPNE